MADKPQTGRIVLGITITLTIVIGFAVGGYLYYQQNQELNKWQVEAKEQNELAVSWKKRASEFEGNYKETTTKLKRSEGDVASLERRQKLLANEKAKVEDQKAEIALVAVSLAEQSKELSEINSYMGECQDNLLFVIRSIAADNYALDVQRLVAPCDEAERLSRVYVQNYS